MVDFWQLFGLGVVGDMSDHDIAENCQPSSITKHCVSRSIVTAKDTNLFVSAAQVKCADGTSYTSAAVIVTVPLGILKNGNITFTPALPANFIAARDRLKAGTTNKLMVKFDRQFMTDDEMKYIWFGVDRTVTGAGAVSTATWHY